MKQTKKPDALNKEQKEQCPKSYSTRKTGPGSKHQGPLWEWTYLFDVKGGPNEKRCK